MAKKKSRLKKILKKLGKVAMLGGAAYGASKLFGGKGPVRGVVRPGTNPSLAMLGETVHPKWGTGVPDRVKMLPSETMGGPDRNLYNDYFGAKKGGRVTGIAKRGFGRALMKGKK